MSSPRPIPGGWRRVQLGEVCEFSYGKSLPAKVRSGEGFAVYGSNGPVGFHGKALTDSETIIIGRKGSFGEVHFSPGPCSPIDTTYYITKQQTDAYLPWLARRLRCLGLKTLNRAAAVPGLNRQDAYRRQLLVPPLAEQKRIAGILDAADALRAKRRESLAQLDTLLQSIFLDMFGDPVTNPKGWDERELKSLVEPDDKISYGVVQPGGDFPSGRPLVRVGDFVGGVLVLEHVKLIDPLIERAYKRSRLKGRELLISCVGSIGTVCTVPVDAEGFNIARAVARVPISGETSRDFMLHALRSAAVQRYFSKETRTVSQPTLNIGTIKEATVIQPPKVIQDRFAAIVESVEDQRARLRAHLAELDTLFASLQSRAFRGDL